MLGAVFTEMLDISRTVTAWVVVTVTPARWYLIVTAAVLAAITVGLNVQPSVTSSVVPSA